MGAEDSGSSGERPTAASEFSQLARTGRGSLARHIISLPLVLFMWVLVGGAFALMIDALAANDGDPDTYVDGRTLEVVGYPIADFAGITLGFLGIWLGLFVAMRYVHGRPFLSLVNVGGRVDWGRLGQGLATYFLLIATAFTVSYLLDPRGYELVIEPGRLLMFIPVVLALIPIQAAAEELLSRGYLLQLFGLATSNAMVLSLASGTLFALPHLANPEASAGGTWIYFADLLVFGFVMALVTLKDGGMELAVGAHVANNVLIFPLVNFEGSFLNTPSVFRLLEPAAGYPDLVSTMVVSAVFYLLVFEVFKRKDPGSPSPDGDVRDRPRIKSSKGRGTHPVDLKSDTRDCKGWWRSSYLRRGGKEARG